MFSDEGNILKHHEDPDLAYNQLIRPYKSALGLHYVAVNTLLVDLQLVLATLLNAIARQRALQWVSALLSSSGAPDELVRISLRREPLVPAAVPGASDIIQE